MKIKCQKCQNILFETYNLREFRYEVTCKNCKTNEKMTALFKLNKFKKETS